MLVYLQEEGNVSKHIKTDRHFLVTLYKFISYLQFMIIQLYAMKVHSFTYL